MKKLPSLLLATLLLGTAADAAPRLRGEERLAHELRGRVAGEPVDCINLSRIRSSRIIDRTAIVYDAGGTVYVNRPRAGRESLRSWNTLVTRTFASRLCSIDTIQLVDSGSRSYQGTVFLGEFVPYHRVRR